MKTCLVVDDSHIIRLLARECLRPLDLQVFDAENGSVALNFCQTSMPDAILLDWNMPIMDGIEFLKRLRATPGGDRPKVVLCTTESATSRIQEAIRAGADEYIMKPFDCQIIAGKLQKVGLFDADA